MIENHKPLFEINIFCEFFTLFCEFFTKPNQLGINGANATKNKQVPERYIFMSIKQTNMEKYEQMRAIEKSYVDSFKAMTDCSKIQTEADAFAVIRNASNASEKTKLPIARAFYIVREKKLYDGESKNFHAWARKNFGVSDATADNYAVVGGFVEEDGQHSIFKHGEYDYTYTHVFTVLYHFGVANVEQARKAFESGKFNPLMTVKELKKALADNFPKKSAETKAETTAETKAETTAEPKDGKKVVALSRKEIALILSALESAEKGKDKDTDKLLFELIGRFKNI